MSAADTVVAAEKPLNIYQKLAQIRKPVEVIQKNKSGYGYRYVTEDIILAKITGLMNKLGVSLIPNIVPGTTEVAPYTYSKTKVLKDGKVLNETVNEILIHADMEWHWVNNENPDDRIIVPWSMVGQQSDASQAFGSGLTYSSRYFMLKYFNIATSDDDPDNWRTLQKEAENEEDRKIAEAIIAEVHEKVNVHLASKPDDKQLVLDTVKKYAREKGKPSGNYFAIRDSATASALAGELSEVLKGGAK